MPAAARYVLPPWPTALRLRAAAFVVQLCFTADSTLNMLVACQVRAPRLKSSSSSALCGALCATKYGVARIPGIWGLPCRRRAHALIQGGFYLCCTCCLTLTCASLGGAHVLCRCACACARACVCVCVCACVVCVSWLEATLPGCFEQTSVCAPALLHARRACSCWWPWSWMFRPPLPPPPTCLATPTARTQASRSRARRWHASGA